MTSRKDGKDQLRKTKPAPERRTRFRQLMLAPSHGVHAPPFRNGACTLALAAANALSASGIRGDQEVAFHHYPLIRILGAVFLNPVHFTGAVAGMGLFSQRPRVAGHPQSTALAPASLVEGGALGR